MITKWQRCSFKDQWEHWSLWLNGGASRRLLKKFSALAPMACCLGASGRVWWDWSIYMGEEEHSRVFWQGAKCREQGKSSGEGDQDMRAISNRQAGWGAYVSPGEDRLPLNPCLTFFENRFFLGTIYSDFNFPSLFSILPHLSSHLDSLIFVSH